MKKEAHAGKDKPSPSMEAEACGIYGKKSPQAGWTSFVEAKKLFTDEGGMPLEADEQLLVHIPYRLWGCAEKRKQAAKIKF